MIQLEMKADKTKRFVLFCFVFSSERNLQGESGIWISVTVLLYKSNIFPLHVFSN